MTSIASPIQFDTQLKKNSPSLASFEETYKTAYTHGLEAIYSIQNVDLKTVRKIEEGSQQVQKNANKPQQPSAFLDPFQLEFDYGEGFRDWIEPFYLREPIQMLGLSSQAQSCFREQGMSRLSDLLSLEAAHLQGIGQGHIDEATLKLDAYLSGRLYNKDDTLGFRSLLRSLSFEIPFKKFTLLLKDYQLEDVFPIVEAEKMELKALNASKADEWKREVVQILSDPQKQTEAVDAFQMIAKVFVLPWMRGRTGIASQEEISERIERVSKDPNEAYLTVHFLQERFTAGEFLFSSFLFQPENGIFCSSESIFVAYLEIIAATHSYFYQCHLSYPLDQILAFLQRDFAKAWKDYSKELIEAVLKRTSAFVIIRNSSGVREVRLP